MAKQMQYCKVKNKYSYYKLMLKKKKNKKAEHETIDAF